MSDGGKHFDNKEVRELCDKWGTKTHIVSAYSSWVNGLIKGTNELFLRVLKQLCAPDLNDGETGSMPTDDIPRSWPDHFDEAIRILNWRLLPSLKFSPRDLMLGLIINNETIQPQHYNPAYHRIRHSTTDSVCGTATLYGYAEVVVAHVLKRKSAFDKRVLLRNPGEVIFSKGQLVHIYRSDLYYTFKMERKLLLKWYVPQQITSRHLNSYVLETLEGNPITQYFSVPHQMQSEPSRSAWNPLRY